jgi:hypothetical protein
MLKARGGSSGTIPMYNRAMPGRKTFPFAFLTIACIWSCVILAHDAVGQTIEVRGTVINAENDSFMLRGVIMFHARPLDPKGDRWTPSGKTKLVGSVGTFEIIGVRPGRYFFSPEGPQAAVTYFKKIECNGQDYSVRPLEIKTGDLAIDCTLTFARDSGAITGQILHGGRPVHAFQVCAIPEAKELRWNLDHLAFSDPTKRNGRFEMRGIIPGDYLVFAVPTKFAKDYIHGVDFDDRIYASAQHLTIKSHENTTITLQTISQKP